MKYESSFSTEKNQADITLAKKKYQFYRSTWYLTRRPTDLDMAKKYRRMISRLEKGALT